MGIICLGLVAGCSKVSRDNYEKIETGMTMDEVESILGSGEVVTGGGAAIGDFELSGKVMRWGTEEQGVEIVFVNNKVTAKAQEGL